jgi:pilus assembly protein CpaB
MGGRLRGCLWLTAGLVVAILAGAVAFITLSRVAEQRGGAVPGLTGTVVDVAAASQAVAVRSQLGPEDVVLKQVPVDVVPDGAVRQVEDAVGKVTLWDLVPGEILVASRLVDPNVVTGDGRLALVVSEDQVLMAFPAEDLMSRTGVLKPGDHVDLLFSLQFPTNRPPAGGTTGGGGEKDQVTFNLLQNVVIAALVGSDPAAGQAAGGAPQALLLTVTPQDALVLKYVKDAGGTVDIVLRAPGAEQPATIEPVDVDYLIKKYQIPTAPGR